MEKVKSRKVRKRNTNLDEDTEKAVVSGDSRVRKKEASHQSSTKKDVVLKKDTQNKIKAHKIRKKELTDYLDINDSVDEEELDREILAEDNLSIGLMILILVGCLVLGITLGYILYRLAMNSSALTLVFSLME